MISLDTNIIVRLVTNDDADQAQQAASLLKANPVYLTKTVILETEWVLRAAYGLSRKTISMTFRRLLGLENMTCESPHQFAQALS